MEFFAGQIRVRAVLPPTELEQGEVARQKVLNG
jgi:hypothetical protein